MDILKLITRQDISPANSFCSRHIQPAGADSWNSTHIPDMDLNELRNAIGRNRNRNRNNTSEDGHNNSGFNAVFEQMGDSIHTSEMVDLLRNKLGYGDENSNQTFRTISCLPVAIIFDSPVVEIYHDGDKVACLTISFNTELIIRFKSFELLSRHFVPWGREFNWGTLGSICRRPI
jgi:hypothetical protein